MTRFQPVGAFASAGPHLVCGLDCDWGVFVGAFACSPTGGTTNARPWTSGWSPWSSTAAPGSSVVDLTGSGGWSWGGLNWETPQGGLASGGNVLLPPQHPDLHLADAIGADQAWFRSPVTGSACYRLVGTAWVADAPTNAVVVGDLVWWEGDLYAAGWELTSTLADGAGATGPYVAYQSLWRYDSGMWTQLARMAAANSTCDQIAFRPGRLWPTSQGLFVGFPVSWPEWGGVGDVYQYNGAVVPCGEAAWVGECAGTLVGVGSSEQENVIAGPGPNPQSGQPGMYTSNATGGVGANSAWTGPPWVLWIDPGSLSGNVGWTEPAVWHGSLWQAAYPYVGSGAAPVDWEKTLTSFKLIQRSAAGAIIATYDTSEADGRAATTRLRIVTTPRALYVIGDPTVHLLENFSGAGLAPLVIDGARLVAVEGNVASESRERNWRALVAFAGDDDVWVATVAADETTSPGLENTIEAPEWMGLDIVPDFRAVDYTVRMMPSTVRVLAVSLEWADSSKAHAPSVSAVTVEYGIPIATEWDATPGVTAVVLEWGDGSKTGKPSVSAVVLEWGDGSKTGKPSVSAVVLEYADGPGTNPVLLPTVPEVVLEWATVVEPPEYGEGVIWLVLDGESPVHALQVFLGHVGVPEDLLSPVRGVLAPATPSIGNVLSVRGGIPAAGIWTAHLLPEDISSQCRVLVRTDLDTPLTPVVLDVRGGLATLLPSVESIPLVTRGGMARTARTVEEGYPVELWPTYQQGTVGETIHLQRPGRYVRVGIIGPARCSAPDVFVQLLRDQADSPWIEYHPGGL